MNFRFANIFTASLRETATYRQKFINVTAIDLQMNPAKPKLYFRDWIIIKTRFSGLGAIFLYKNRKNPRFQLIFPKRTGGGPETKKGATVNFTVTP